MKVDLTGQKILITGASRGIGKAIATAVAEAGGDVALHFNSGKDEIHSLAEILPGVAIPIQADLKNADETGELISESIDKLGGLTAIVNNAGIAISASPEASAAEFVAVWEETMAVNLRATGQLCADAIKHFSQQKEGRILNISSRAAFRGDTPEYLAYAASKGGVVALTRSIARGYGKKGIVAFNIAPGFTRTDMAQDFIDQYGEAFALNDIALPKLTEPSDIAPLAVLLLSGLADHATGGTFDMNAGSYVH